MLVMNTVLPLRLRPVTANRRWRSIARSERMPSSSQTSLSTRTGLR